MKLKYLSVILVSLLACNPVKQVLKDQNKFDQVAQEVVRSGKYCVNDTTVITEVKDSVIYKDSIIERITSIPCKDFDTTIGRARIKVSSGVLTYTAKDSIVVRTKTITNSIRDRALENILRSDIIKLESTLTKRDLDLNSAKLEAKEIGKELAWLKFKFWIVFLCAMIVIFRNPIIRLISAFI